MDDFVVTKLGASLNKESVHYVADCHSPQAPAIKE